MAVSRFVLCFAVVVLASGTAVRAQTTLNFTQIGEDAASQAQQAYQNAVAAQQNTTNNLLQQAEAQAAAANADAQCLIAKFGNGTEFGQRTVACASVAATQSCPAGCINILNQLTQSCRNTLASSAAYGAGFSSLFNLCGVSYQVTARPSPPPYATGLVLPAPPPPGNSTNGTAASEGVTTTPTAAPTGTPTATVNSTTPTADSTTPTANDTTTTTTTTTMTTDAPTTAPTSPATSSVALAPGGSAPAPQSASKQGASSMAALVVTAAICSMLMAYSA